MGSLDTKGRGDVPAALGVIGVGAIAEAIVTGLCDGRDAETAIHLSPRGAARASRLAARYPAVRIAESNRAAAERAEVVLLCVRPQDARAALADLTLRAGQGVISVIAGIRISELRTLVGPAEVIVRAIPLPAVARRSGVTAIHPPSPIAQAIFDPLGGVMAVDHERALEALSASTATLAAHLAYLDTISGWLTDQGIAETDATRYVASVFGGLSGSLLSAQPTNFGTLADEYATAGGLNEQFLATVRDARSFEIVEQALDEVADRLRTA